jgi:hypothetical protein
MRPRHLAIVLAGTVVAGCGGTGVPSTSQAPGSNAPRPALLTAPRRPGEVVVSGDTAPKTAGPYAFHGRYRVRFRQYAPEDPSTDFSGQTPFVVDLERSPGMPVIHLFKAAAAHGERRLTLEGRLYVDVSFGDFPFVIRFTPEGG